MSKQASEVNALAKIQQAVKAGKNQYNAFGKYKYRNAESIMEAAKPICNENGFALVCTDDLIHMEGRFYVKATAQLINSAGSIVYSATAYAREEETKKGMDGSQITGASSSYARKYALSGLFSLDDNQDSDATNTHGKQENVTTEVADVLGGWKQELGKCKTMTDLKKLYNENKQTIEENAAIKILFTRRKIEING